MLFDRSPTTNDILPYLRQFGKTFFPFFIKFLQAEETNYEQKGIQPVVFRRE